MRSTFLLRNSFAARARTVLDVWRGLSSLPHLRQALPSLPISISNSGSTSGCMHASARLEQTGGASLEDLRHGATEQPSMRGSNSTFPTFAAQLDQRSFLQHPSTPPQPPSTMSIPTAVPAPNIGGLQGKGGPRAKREAQNRKYGTPLPLLLPESALYKLQPGAASSSQSSVLNKVLPDVLTRRVYIPPVVGVFDAASQSVWVTGSEDMETLFNRGFFGKGTLSRSEPSWHSRRADLVRGGSGEYMTAG